MGFDELPEKLTKADIQNWINENRIEVEEVEKGKYDDKTNFDRLISDLEAYKNDLEDEVKNDIKNNGSAAKEKNR